MVPASRQVLVTVDAVIPRDELRRIPGSVVISRHFVSAIAVAPGAAAPTSSLPYYLADFDGLRAWTAAEDPLEHSPHVRGRRGGRRRRRGRSRARRACRRSTRRRSRPPSACCPTTRSTGHARRVDDRVAREAVPGRLDLLGGGGLAARLGVLPPRQGHHRAVDDADHQRRLLRRRRAAPGAVRPRRVARRLLGAHDHGRRGELRVVLPGRAWWTSRSSASPRSTRSAEPTTARS